MDVQVRLLGEFEVLTASGASINISARKARALLAYLCVRAGRPQQREHLANLLWGDVSTDDYARKSVRQALTVLRRDLPEGILEATRDSVWIERARASVDVAEFERLAQSGDKQELEQSIALYRGELLEGFRSRADAFDDWLSSERQRLRERAVAALGRLHGLQREQHDLNGATTSAIRMVALDPLHEEAHRSLMRLYAEQGRMGDAFEQYETCRQVLERELGHGVGPETVELLRQLREFRKSSSEPLPAPSAETASHLRVVAVIAVTDSEPEGEAATGWDALATAVAEQGGTLVRRTSSSAMAVFGAEHTQGSEPTRAVCAALRVLQKHPGFASGVAYAHAMVTLTGGLPAVVGEAVSQAAHLAASAEAGSIIVSDGVRQALRGGSLAQAVMLTPLPDAPGRARAWTVVEAQGEPESDSRRPFVGRTRELSIVKAVLDACTQSSLGQLIVVRGEAGIGKTRLVEEMSALAERDGYRVYRAAALDFGPRHERDAMAQLTRALLGASRAPGAHTETQDMSAPASVRDHGLLLELAGLSGTTSREAADQSVREARRERQLELWLELWQRQSARCPTMVAIDDFHWLDPATLDPLARLLALTQASPLLLVISTRPTGNVDNPRWLGSLRGHAVTTLDLGPLSSDEGQRLAEELRVTDSDQVRAAFARSAGHPLFLEQILKSQGPVQLSASIYAVVQMRLDQLGVHEAAALRAAAVLGSQFDLSTLSEITGGDVPIEQLLGSGLIRRVSGRFVFSHALIRDAVYETLLPANRRALHARAARAVKRVDLALAAEHLDRAEAEGAAEAYLEAARDADGRERVTEALLLAERGLALASDATLSFLLTEIRARLLQRLGRRDAAEQAARDALAIAATSAHKAAAWVVLAECLRGTPRDAEAMHALEAAQSAAASDDHSMLSHIQYLIGSVLFPRAQAKDCLVAHQRALSHAKLAGSPHAEARALSGLGDAYYIQGDLRRATQHFESCVALAEQLGLRRLARVNRVMIQLVQVFLLVHPERAVSEITRLAEDAREELDLPGEAVARSSAIFGIVLTADAEQQETCARLVAESARRSGRERLGFASAAYIIEAQNARQPSSDHEQQLDAVYERCSGDVPFAALSVLAPMLLCALGAKRRERIFDEADRLLRTGQFVSHGVYVFIRAALTVCLRTRDLDRLEQYAVFLEEYTRPHEVGWGSFFCDWARSLAAWQRGQRDAKLQGMLASLKEFAEAQGLVREAKFCAEALATRS